MRSLAYEASSTPPASPDGIWATLLGLFEVTREAAQSLAQTLLQGFG